MTARLASALSLALALGACQSARQSPVATLSHSAPSVAAAAGVAAPSTFPATMPAVYSHAEAVRLYRAARYHDGETLCLKAIAEIESTRGKNSSELASPLDDLAAVYLRQAKYHDAAPLIERAESLLDKSKPADALLLGRIAINKGWRLYSLGEIRASLKAFEEGRDLIRKNQKGESLELAELINNVGLVYGDVEDPDEEPNPRRIRQAKIFLLRGWQMRRRLAGDQSAEVSESLNNLGMHLLYHAEDDEELATALTTLKTSLDISEKVYGKDHPEIAINHINLAVALKTTEDSEAAEEHLRSALAMTEKALGKNHPDRAYELQVLGQLEQDRGNYTEAENDLQEAVRIYEVVYGPNHPNVANPLSSLRALYEEMNDAAKANAAQDRIDRLRGKDI